MTELAALNSPETFRFDGTPADGLLLFYADTGYVYLTPAIFAQMEKALAGKTIPLGTGPADQRPLGSLGAWLRDQGIVRDIVAQLAAVLIHFQIAQPAADNALLFRSAS